MEIAALIKKFKPWNCKYSQELQDHFSYDNINLNVKILQHLKYFYIGRDNLRYNTTQRFPNKQRRYFIQDYSHSGIFIIDGKLSNILNIINMWIVHK